MKESNLKDMRRAAEQGVAVNEETALAILQCDADEIPEVLAAATMLRKRYFGRTIHLCSIMNAKSGSCSEDCTFCAQSAHHETHSSTFPLASRDELIGTYREASELPIGHFGVVTSGRALSDSDVSRICDAARSCSKPGVEWCASLGCVDRDRLLKLKEAGFKRFHHNLESSESFFPSVCTTHSYELRIETVRTVKEVGLEICCGGILGLGESLEQRVEFASILAREKVDSIPLNFLIPIAGTRLENLQPMAPLDMIRSIAMFRMMNPASELKVCAGRVHLRDLQSMLFYAGATGMMVGPLLTVAGRDVQQDMQVLRDLGLI
ncbi:MAG: biotin synthase BioB [Acidobacteriota bacterium]